VSAPPPRSLARRLALALVVLAALPANAVARARFDTKVFALIGKPGFPAMAYAGHNGRVYEGTYDNPTGDTLPSRVFEYSGDGALLRSWVMKGQDLSQAHGVQVGTMGPSGRLLLLDKSPPRVVRLDRTTGAQKTIARFPAGAVPNYAAWGPDRALYVTDYENATIWRVPPSGGTPAVWVKDAALDGGPFGLTGIRLSADRTFFYVAMQSQAGLGGGNPTAGRIVKIPITAAGKPGRITPFWESGPLDAPDGFGIAKSGRIYVALLLANAIAVLNPDGTERERAASPLFDSPSSVSSLGTRLMVANQSYVMGSAADQAILDVEAGERGLREFIPKRRRAR
jgi:sugar lactone lactonase YvrE